MPAGRLPKGLARILRSGFAECDFYPVHSCAQADLRSFVEEKSPERVPEAEEKGRSSGGGGTTGKGERTFGVGE